MASRRQVDQAGDRLRNDPSDLSALAILFEYCKDVQREIAEIPGLISGTTSLRVSERAGKSFESIKAKLGRQTTKLSQIQDIEGCRIIVDSPIEQDALVFRLKTTFPEARIKDHRSARAGYRAVHVIPKRSGAQYEIQIRTMLQHAWAQVSEALSDRSYQELKYVDYDGVYATMVDENDEWLEQPDAADWARNLANASASVRLTEEKELLLWELYSGYLSARSDDDRKKIDRVFHLATEVSGTGIPLEQAALQRWISAAHAEVLKRKERLRLELQKLLREIE